MADARFVTEVLIRLPVWLVEPGLPAGAAGDGGCMALATWAASENVARGTGGPFGACVRDDATGEVIGVGVNLAQASGNPVLHAETVALSMAAGRMGGSVTLFTSCEPCIMCLGAAHWAQVRRIVSAATKADAEAVGFSEGSGTAELRAEMTARGVVFVDGFMREAGAEALRRYANGGGLIYGPKS